MEERKTILTVSDLTKTFTIKSKKVMGKPSYLKAVNHVSFEVKEGETLGIIGESGCGKSTLGKLILNLIPATSGSVKFDGKDVYHLPAQEMKALRNQMNMIFQDPYSSLDPRKTAAYSIEEPMIIHNIGTEQERKERVNELLRVVGLDEYHGIRFPHEFSGGQRQRINIARALALNPKLLVCDEPVSALDVSVQAQVINLLKELKEKMKLTYIFISHDLGVVKYISDRIVIMYLGTVVEVGDSATIYENPIHPYTKALFSAIPPASPLEKKEKIKLTGEIPSPLNMPKGCAFCTRCPYATDRCRNEIPTLKNVDDRHQVACFLNE